MLVKLVSNSQPQVIRLPQPPKAVVLQAAGVQRPDQKDTGKRKPPESAQAPKLRLQRCGDMRWPLASRVRRTGSHTPGPPPENLETCQARRDPPSDLRAPARGRPRPSDRTPTAPASRRHSVTSSLPGGLGAPPPPLRGLGSGRPWVRSAQLPLPCPPQPVPRGQFPGGTALSSHRELPTPSLHHCPARLLPAHSPTATWRQGR
ncbi:hypothetical protein AAY473_036997 [Plecturocebus cupreus]